MSTQIVSYPVSAPQLISRQVLASAASSVTFSSIPQNFTHLKLFVASSVPTTAGLIQINFNGDVTAADYFINYQTMSFTTALTTVGAFTSAGAMVGSFNTNSGHAEITILDYSSLTLVKAFLGNSLGNLWFNGGGIWSNAAAAINSMVITNSAGGNINAGSVFSLYGIP